MQSDDQQNDRHHSAEGIDVPADAHADEPRLGRGRGGRGRGRHRVGPGEFGPGFGPGPFGPGPFGPGPFGPGGMGPGRGGPHARGGRRRRKGAVRLAILSLLAERPSNGYGLIQEIAERTHGTWTPSPGSVYPTLQQLVDEGLVTTSGESGAEFRLTEAGATYVAEQAEDLAAAWQSARHEAAGSDELRDSVAALMGVVTQYRLASAEQRARAVEQLDATRKALYRILSE